MKEYNEFDKTLKDDTVDLLELGYANDNMDSFLTDTYNKGKKVELSDNDFIASFTEASLDVELSKYEEQISDNTIIEEIPINMDNDYLEKEAQIANDFYKNMYANTELQLNDNDTYYKSTVKEKSKKKESSFKKFVAALLVVSIVGGGTLGLGIGVGRPLAEKYIASSVATTAPSVSNAEVEEVPEFKFNKGVVPTTDVNLSNPNTLVKDIVKIAEPSVISISSIIISDRSSYWSTIPYEQEGSGSGIIFHKTEEKIFIVTNNHVISDATHIRISFNDDEQIPATLVGRDEQSDLAVISINVSDIPAEVSSSIRIASFGNSDNIEVGDTAIAIGNALGEGKSATAGIISATNKEILISDKKLNVIKTDAAINPGNSGGALVNDRGQVIGINTAKYSRTGVEGIGYAIPINDAKPIIEQLINNGTVPRPYLGITGTNVSDEESAIYGLPVGVLVRDVLAGSSAALAGIQPTDIIIEFGNTKIMNFDSLTNAIKAQNVGDSVDVKVIREGRTPLTLKVVLQDANQKSAQPKVIS